MKKVAILLFDGVSLFEAACAYELFALPRPEFTDWYQCQSVSFSTSPLRTSMGLQLVLPDHASIPDRCDVLIVPSWSTHGGEIPDSIRCFVMEQYHRGAQVISFCSGAFLLAALGLLDGKSATTHWRYAAAFKQQFPNVHYVNDVLYVYDGRVGCSAGSAAAIDLGLEIIRRDFGHAVANKVAKRMVIPMQRKGSQAQYADIMDVPASETLHLLMQKAIERLPKGVTVEDMAAWAPMSRRSFNRHFKQATQLTPNEWLTFQKLNRARALLEETQESVEQIAHQSGFPNAMAMRHHFRLQYKTTPMAYREQFTNERLTKDRN